MTDRPDYATDPIGHHLWSNAITRDGEVITHVLQNNISTCGWRLAASGETIKALSMACVVRPSMETIHGEPDRPRLHAVLDMLATERAKALSVVDELERTIAWLGDRYPLEPHPRGQKAEP